MTVLRSVLWTATLGLGGVLIAAGTAAGQAHVPGVIPSRPFVAPGGPAIHVLPPWRIPTVHVPSRLGLPNVRSMPLPGTAIYPNPSPRTGPYYGGVPGI